MDKKMSPDEIMKLGREAESARRGEEAKLYYEQLAKMGNTEAMDRLAFMYQHGKGINQSYEKALFWYKKMIDYDYELGWWNVGYLYEDMKNYLKAAECYEKVIDNNGQYKDVALRALVRFHIEGLVKEQDNNTAIEWYRQAADKGSEDAMRELGNIYRFGKGTEKNIDEAIYWYCNAATNDDDKSMLALANIYYRGEGVEIDFEKAKYWSLEGAKLGNEDCMLNIADCYYEGEGVDQDFVAAMAWFKKAAELDNTQAMFRLSYMYLLGQGEEENPYKAKDWSEKAVEAGHKCALVPLGMSFYDLLDFDNAFHIFHKAVLEPQDTYGYGEYWLGRLYLEGNGVEKDVNHAIDWFNKSVECGNTDAMVAIGDLYADGDVIEKDLNKAKEWYQKALDAGDEDAQERLDNLI